jgi:Skp family chaperone for outer membrane proteins
MVAAVAAAVTGALVLSSTLAQPRETTSRPAAPTRIAVCDVFSVLTRSQRAAELTEQFTKRDKDIEAETQRMSKEISLDLDMLSKYQDGSADFERKLDEARQKQIKLEAWQKSEMIRLKRDQYIQTLALYNRTITAAAELAKERGIDLIVNERQKYTGNPKLEPMENLFGKIDTKKIIYLDGRLDITDEVLARINAAEAKGGDEDKAATATKPATADK